ncbi:MAG: bifunctional [glutamate--ammonia ligase]-adenylyl-L-tyrosine phosphorylase/[glutamate--ammonia-ligase] adenylyltransferase, partial [Casimicrobiaceae bacterium]
MHDLDFALAFSHYAARSVAANPALRDELAATIESPFDWSDARGAIDTAVHTDDAVALARGLRQLRRRAFLHTLARDITDRASLDEVVATMTCLAETALDAATTLHARALIEIHGTPTGAESGEPQDLVVVAMGKLGGSEL